MSELTLDFIEELLNPPQEIPRLESPIDVTCPQCFRVISYDCINKTKGQFHSLRIQWFNAQCQYYGVNPNG